MNDIVDFEFDQLQEERGFGQIKVNKIKNKYEEYLQNIDKFNIELTKENKIDLEVDEYYKDLSIDILEVFGIKKGLLDN